jgi:hypothetical protein
MSESANFQLLISLLTEDDWKKQQFLLVATHILTLTERTKYIKRRFVHFRLICSGNRTVAFVQLTKFL